MDSTTLSWLKLLGGLPALLLLVHSGGNKAWSRCCNGCIMGEARWSISEAGHKIKKEKERCCGEVTFWDWVDARDQEVTCNLHTWCVWTKAWVRGTEIGPNTFSQENVGLRLLGFPWWGSATLFLSLSLIYGALGSRGQYPNHVRVSKHWLLSAA